MAVTKGTSASERSGGQYEQLAAGTVHDLADRADDGAVLQLGAQAFQLVDVELLTSR